MTLAIVAAVAGVVVMAPLLAWAATRWQRLRPLVPLLAGCALGAALSLSVVHLESARLVGTSLGSLRPTRLEIGVVLAAWAAAVLAQLVFHRHALSGWGVLMAVGVGVLGSLALVADSLMVMALLLGAMGLAVWIRWQRSAGSIAPMRSLGRQVAIGAAALLATAVLVPSERLGQTPPAVAGMLVLGGMAAFTGLIPFSVWAGAASRVSPVEAALWWIWLLPVGLMSFARLLVSSPPGLTEVLQILGLSLGICTAIFWAAAAARGDPGTRYLRVLASDVGLMFVALASGRADGLAAVLVLLLLHWLAGSLLAEPRGSRSQLLAWVGLSGVPPFGGFAGRVLVVVSVGYLGPVLVFLVLLAMGLQLVGSAVGVHDSAGTAERHLPAPSELVSMAAGVAPLVLGLFSEPALHLIFGIHQ